MAFVTSIGYRRVGIGQTITIFGGGFDVYSRVTYGDTEATILDFDDDYIEFLAPLSEGDYDVKVLCGDSNLDAGSIHISALAETPSRSVARDYTTDDFDGYIRSLFPRGIALAMWRGSNISKLINALALAMLYLWSVIKGMLEATDPAHTSNLDEWENELGLPISTNISQDFGERRSEVYRVECTEGGCCRAFYKRLLYIMGIDADIYSYTMNPEEFEGYDFGEDDPRFYLKIVFHVKEEDFVQFRAGESEAGDYILDFNQYKEESVFDEIKQAHTKIIYGYDDGIRIGYMLGSDGTRIVDSNNEPLTTKTQLW